MELSERIERFGYDPTMGDKVLNCRPYVDQFWRRINKARNAAESGKPAVSQSRSPKAKGKKR